MNSIESYIDDIQKVFGEVEYVNLVKSGKEAIVHLLRVDGNLMALKIYKDDTKFSSRNEYFDVEEIGDKRLIRAAKKKSRAGLRTVQNLWINREYSILEQLYAAGALVPEPIMKLEKATLMEYLGSADIPAPRLSEARITYHEATKIFHIIHDHLKLFAYLGFTHGDLSAYNILWYRNMPYFIDFPQVIYRDNRNYRQMLLRDLDNVQKYFNKYEIPHLNGRLSEILSINPGNI